MKTSLRHRFIGAAFVAFRYHFSSKLTLGLALLALSLPFPPAPPPKLRSGLSRWAPVVSAMASVRRRRQRVRDRHDQ